MKLNLEPLKEQAKLLFAIELKPVQGERFQPTGFPSLGAATYQTKYGVNLLVESPQSMANRLETVCWNNHENQIVTDLEGVSYIRVNRKNQFLTSSITEAHRLNSPYLLEGSDKSFFNTIKNELGGLAAGPIDRKLLADTLLKYDINSLLHGVFLAKKDLAGGRLRVARAISAFIEAKNVHQAISGGVKNDHVNPSGSTKTGFGNVPFSREEYTAENITLFVNIDLAQIRGYGLGPEVQRLLILIALYKLRALVNGNLRLRTACDFEPATKNIAATRPDDFSLPSLEDIRDALMPTIDKLKNKMIVTTVNYDDEIKTDKNTGTDEKTLADADEE